MIDITGVNLVELTKKAYELSMPAGLGFIHYKPEPLSDPEANKIVDGFKNNKNVALNLDYVNGRACKLVIFREGRKLTIRESWYDHTDYQLEELLKSVFPEAVDELKEIQHGVACNCFDCQAAGTSVH